MSGGGKGLEVYRRESGGFASSLPFFLFGGGGGEDTVKEEVVVVEGTDGQSKAVDEVDAGDRMRRRREGGRELQARWSDERE